MWGVPRVSDAHLAARRQQIIDAARVCFLRNGFHQTSMQDVIREANLSVGAVYRYFPSKTDIITAIAEQVVGHLAELFRTTSEAEAPSLEAVMAGAVDFATANSGPDGMLRLAVQVWSESLHDAPLGEFVARVYRRLRDVVVQATRQAHARGELPAGADPDAVGTVLFALMPGYALQRILTGGPDPELFKAGLRTLLSPSPGSTRS